MKTGSFLPCIGAAILCAGCVTAPIKYRSFEVHRHDGVGPSFNYSSAAATSADPIVITVVGRPMTLADREFRTDLQKNWLQTNVPANFELTDRAQYTCDVVRPENDPRCDGYTFRDPATKKLHYYYFYLGNWPHPRK
jgi:hypothetical protein